MITKEQAREIYNHYSQIEKTNEAISALRDYYEQEKKKEPRDGVILKDKYAFGNAIHMEIPEGYLGGNSGSISSCRIFNIDVPDAILILESHLLKLQKELDEMQKETTTE